MGGKVSSDSFPPFFIEVAVSLSFMPTATQLSTIRILLLSKLPTCIKVTSELEGYKAPYDFTCMLIFTNINRQTIKPAETLQ